MIRIRKALLPTASVAAFLALWHAVAGLYPPENFPGPLEVLAALRELAASGVLWGHIRISLARFGAAYLLAATAGIPLGLFFGRNLPAHRAVDPILQVLRPISPIAWFPLAVLWFGIGDAPAVFIIFLAAFFPILLSTIGAVRGIAPAYLRVAQNFGAGRAMTFLQVVIPAAFPGIMVGLHIAVGTGWIHLVAGEMLGAQSGLGYLIVDARNFLRTDWILAGMLVVGVLGLAIYRLMLAAEGIIRRRWGISA